MHDYGLISRFDNSSGPWLKKLDTKMLLSPSCVRKVLLYETLRQFYSVHLSTIEYFPKSILEVDQRKVKKLKVEIALQQSNCLSSTHFVFTKQSSFIISAV